MLRPEIVALLLDNKLISTAEDVLSIIPKSKENQNLLIKVRRGDKGEFIKVFEESAGNRVFAEVAALRLFAEANIPVPKYIESGFLKFGTESLPFLITKEVEGVCLYNEIDQLDSKQIDAIATSIVEVMKRQQQIPVLADEVATGTMRSSLSSLREKFRKTNTDNETIRRLINTCEENATALTERESAQYVTHDWRLRHIFIENMSLSGLLDLEYVKLNDFAVEVGHLLHDIRLNGTEGAIKLGLSLISKLGLLKPAEDESFAQRVKIYMSRQALTHIASKLLSGAQLEDFRDELDLAGYYQQAQSLEEIFQPIPA
jgi:hypothetical protein